MAASLEKDADVLGTSLDLAVEALQRIGGVKLEAVLDREAHAGQHIRLSLVHQGCKLGNMALS